MTSQLIVLRLEHAAQRLGERLAALEDRLQDGDAAVSREYAEVAVALAAILPALGRAGAMIDALRTLARAHGARHHLGLVVLDVRGTSSAAPRGGA